MLPKAQRYQDIDALKSAVRATALVEYKKFFGGVWVQGTENGYTRRGSILLHGPDPQPHQRYERQAFEALKRLKQAFAGACDLVKVASEERLVGGEAAGILRDWVRAFEAIPSSQKQAKIEADLPLIHFKAASWLRVREPLEKLSVRGLLVRALDHPEWRRKRGGRPERRPTNRELAVISLLWGNWPKARASSLEGWTVADIRRAEERAIAQAKRRARETTG